MPKLTGHKWVLNEKKKLKAELLKPFDEKGKPDRAGTKNLQSVTQSSDLLLEFIDCLQDLSKIEAGKMGVEAKPFSVKKLITSCCTMVSAPACCRRCPG